MSKIYQGIFHPYAVGTVISRYLGSHFTEKKERNRWRKFSSSTENAVWSILLKYQEMWKYKHSLTKIETSYIVAFLNDTKGGFPVMAEITRILAVNICRQFFFVITTTASTRCLVENFQLKADFLSWQKPLAS